MTDPVAPDPAPPPLPPPPAWSGPAGVALIVAGFGMMILGQMVPKLAAMAFVGLAVIAAGVVVGVISQRGK